MDTGSFILDVLVGVGAFLFGLGMFVGMLALRRTLKRVNGTLDVVDRQLEALSVPLNGTVVHVEGIAGGVHRTTERLSDAANAVGEAAGTLNRTAQLAREALVPAIVNVGAALSGITAGLRRLVTGKDSPDRPQD